MAKISAGLLVYRRRVGRLEVFLVHPGGPYWQHRDLGAWSIPKGEVAEDEELLATAHREFGEETGFDVQGTEAALGHVRQTGGKVVYAWAIGGDLDPEKLRSNTFQIEWPRGSGVERTFPEVDRANWFSISEGHRYLIAAQTVFLDKLEELLESTSL